MKSESVNDKQRRRGVCIMRVLAARHRQYILAQFTASDYMMEVESVIRMTCRASSALFTSSVLEPPSGGGDTMP